jgi:hypothetical protein
MNILATVFSAVVASVPLLTACTMETGSASSVEAATSGEACGGTTGVGCAPGLRCEVPPGSKSGAVGICTGVGAAPESYSPCGSCCSDKTCYR